jgi:hypothetical protein
MQFQYGNSMHAPTAAALMAQTYAFQMQHLPPQRIMAQHIAAAIQPQPAARQTTTASQRRAARRKAGVPKVSDRAPGRVRARARAQPRRSAQSEASSSPASSRATARWDALETRALSLFTTSAPSLSSEAHSPTRPCTPMHPH